MRRVKRFLDGVGVAAMRLTGLPIAALAGLSLWWPPALGLLVLVLLTKW